MVLLLIIRKSGDCCVYELLVKKIGSGNLATNSWDIDFLQDFDVASCILKALFII